MPQKHDPGLRKLNARLAGQHRSRPISPRTLEQLAADLVRKGLSNRTILESTRTKPHDRKTN